MGATIKLSESVKPRSLRFSVSDKQYLQCVLPVNYRVVEKARLSRNPICDENELVKKYFDNLIYFLKKKNISSDLLDDVVQETWLVVLQKLRKKEIRNVEKIKSFIFSVASNQLIMAHRKNMKIEADELSDDPIEPSKSEPDQLLEAKQMGQQIVDVVSGMGRPRDRDILTCFFLTNCTKSELAEKYNLSLAHFDRVKYRSRERFMHAWQCTYSE